MTGYRRGSSGAALANAKQERRRERFVKELGQAKGPRDRAAAATRYIRSVVATLDGQAAEGIADQLVNLAQSVGRPRKGSRR